MNKPNIYYAYSLLYSVRLVRVVSVAVLARLTWRSADVRVAERTDETENSKICAFWKFTSPIRGVRSGKRTEEELNQRFSINVWTLQELEKAEKWMNGAAGPSGKSHAMFNGVYHGIYQMNVWLHEAIYIFVLLNATRHTARANTYKNNKKNNKKIRTMLNTSPRKASGSLMMS